MTDYDHAYPEEVEASQPREPEGRRTPGAHLPIPWPGEDLLSVPSAYIFHESRRAVTQPERFCSDEDSPWPVAKIGSRKRPGVAIMRPPQTDSPGLDPDRVNQMVEEMWRQRSELSDLDADILDGMMAAWIVRSVADSERQAWIGVDELLALRGVRKKFSGSGRRGGYEEEQRAAVMRAVNHLTNMWVDMGIMEVPTRTGGGKNTRRMESKRVHSHLLSVDAITSPPQQRLDAPEEIDGFVFRPGTAISLFLDDVGRQVTLLAAQALRYHPERQKWEKRLARTLSWRWRVRARKPDGHSQPYRIAQLIRYADAEVDKRRPLRTRERLEKALDTLQADGVIANWQYESFHDRLEDSRKGWVERWMASTVVIEPPDEMKELSEQIEARAPKGDSGPAKARRGREVGAPDVGERLKAWRKEQDYSQSRLAEMLGIPQAAISSYERGKAIPSAARAEQIETLIKADNTPGVQ